MTTEQVVVEEPARRISPVVIVAIVVILLALAGFLAFTFLSGGEDPEPAPVAPIQRGQVAPPTPSPSPTPPPSETFEVFEAKDPFRPLVVPPAAGGGGGGGGTAAPGASPGASPAPPPPGAASGARGAPAPSGGRRVTLLDIIDRDGRQQAQVKIGSTVHTVSPGEVFADNFKLVSISGNCATLLHGDDKFTLCEGEEVIK